MRFLWFLFLLNAVYAQVHFGTPFMKHSRLCRQWNCLNEKLGLPENLPPKEHYATTLKNLVSEEWHVALTEAIDICFGDRPRSYSNTCQGQALMHCVMDQLSDKCPDKFFSKNDKCAPISSLAGFDYLFSQSRYVDFERNLPAEGRPSWFLRNYFNGKCCELPNLLNVTVMSECRVVNFIKYYMHNPVRHNLVEITNTNQRADANELQIVDINEIPTDNKVDPLECCDMSGYIEPSWRSECGFAVSWDRQRRLTISEPEPTTTTARPVNNDVKIVPVSCQEENCVFSKLNITSATGAVNIEAFTKLLDNLTNHHPAWSKAKARVITKCLIHQNYNNYYEADCEINKLLACTFDVLTENCPHAKKDDPCKHNNGVNNGMSCQISSAKYRPKNRRQFCGLPSLVHHELLSQCGVSSITGMEYVPEPSVRKHHSRSMCKEITPATKCLLKKMNALNKYEYLDYFKMKEKITEFSENKPDWAPFKNGYMSIFVGTPTLYREHCNSAKKLLNIIDTMLMTCPISKRKQTFQCRKTFDELTNLSPLNQNVTKERLNQLLGYFHNIFLDNENRTQHNPLPHSHKRIDKSTIMAVPDSPPKVTVLPIAPAVMSVRKRPLVLTPVYQRLYRPVAWHTRRYPSPVLRTALVPIPLSP